MSIINYSKGKLKVKSTKGKDIPFMPSTLAQNIVNDRKQTKEVLSDVLSSYEQRLANIAKKDAIKVMNIEPDASNTSEIANKSLIGYVCPLSSSANAGFEILYAKITNKPVGRPWLAGDTCEIEYKIINKSTSTFEDFQFLFNNAPIIEAFDLEPGDVGSVYAHYVIKGQDVKNCHDNDTQLVIAATYQYSAPAQSVVVSVPSVAIDCIPDATKMASNISIALTAAGFRQDTGAAAPTWSIQTATLASEDTYNFTKSSLSTSSYTTNANYNYNSQRYNYANIGRLKVVGTASGNTFLNVSSVDDMELLWPFSSSNTTTPVDVEYETDYGIIKITGSVYAYSKTSSSYGGYYEYPRYVDFNGFVISRTAYYEPSFDVQTEILNSPASGLVFKAGETIHYKTTITNNSRAFYISPLSITSGYVRTNSPTTIQETIAPGDSLYIEGSITLTEADIAHAIDAAAIETEITGTTGLGKAVSVYERNELPIEYPEPSLLVECIETSTPANANGYAANEAIRFNIHAVNNGNLTLTNIAISDSGGYTHTISSLAPGAETILQDNSLTFSVPSNSTLSIASHSVSVDVDDAYGIVPEIEVGSLNVLLADRETFTFTIDTSKGSVGRVASFGPFAMSASNPAYVDWGDGTTELISNTTAIPTHTYTTSGTYQISTIFGDWGQTELAISSSYSSTPTGDALYYFRSIVTSIDSELPKISTTNFDYIFHYCTNLTSVHKNIFKNNASSIISMRYAFYNCKKLASVPKELFYGCDAITTFGNCFYGCTSLTAIPSELFSSCISNQSFSCCFLDCTSLASIPSGLFDNNTAVTSFGSCFWDCTSLASIPSGLFDNNTAVTSFYTCFFNCESLASIPTELFDNNTAVTDFSTCFHGCKSLTSIPSGLFDNNTAVTTFEQCFAGCSSLQSIPSGLFDNNTAATNFEKCFGYCTSLTSIPANLFSNCSTATNFNYCFYNCTALQTIDTSPFNGCTASATAEYCFQYCTSLQTITGNIFNNCSSFTSFLRSFEYCTSLQTITGNIFNNCTSSKSASFYYCFNSCSSLTSIPSGLFAGCVKATNFSYCFNECTSLTSIPANLFSDCSGATSFEYCFYNCTGLQAIDTSPFNGCTATASCQGCFYGCSNLQTITGNIFNNCSKITSFANCFYGCSKLGSISSGLFNGCSGTTSFQYCFNRCSALASLPAGLFDSCTAVTSFNYCFYYCSSLSSIPVDLFRYNTNVTSISYLFRYCSQLGNFSVRFGSTKITTRNYCFNNISSTFTTGSRIIYAPSGSNTYTYLNSYSSSNTSLGLTIVAE